MVQASQPIEVQVSTFDIDQLIQHVSDFYLVEGRLPGAANWTPPQSWPLCLRCLSTMTSATATCWT